MELWLLLTASLLCFHTNSVIAQLCDDLDIISTADIEFGSSFPSNVPAQIGSPLALNCVVSLNPGIVSDTPPMISSFVWTKNGIVQVQFDAQMVQILAAQTSDGGDYTCSAETDFPCTTIASDITVVTTDPVVTIVPSSDLSVEVGTRVELECQVEGWPTPMISWRKASASGTVDEISTNPMLVIDSATLSDAAQYSCRGTNSRNVDVKTISLTVTVPETDPPTQSPTNMPATTEQDDNSGNGNSGNANARPATEDGFYIAIAVVAFVCIVVTVLTVIVTILWCVKKKATAKAGQEVDDEEIMVEEQTL